MLPILRTARLTLTQPNLGDIENLVAACNDSAIQRVIGFARPYTAADASAYITHFVPRGWHAANRYTWVLRSRADRGGGALLGQISLNMASTAPEATIGYWLHPAARHHGYIPEAAATVLAHAFTTPPGRIVRVRWQAYAGNFASARIAAKLGFRYDTQVSTKALGWNVNGEAWTAHLDAAQVPLPQAWDILA